MTAKDRARYAYNAIAIIFPAAQYDENCKVDSLVVPKINMNNPQHIRNFSRIFKSIGEKFLELETDPREREE